MATKPSKKPATPKAPAAAEFIEVPILIRVSPDGEFEAVADSDYAPENYANDLFTSGSSPISQWFWLKVRIPRTIFSAKTFTFTVTP